MNGISNILPIKFLYESLVLYILMRPLLSLLTILTGLIFWVSCSDKDTPDSGQDAKNRRAILVYAVAYNDLSYNLQLDMAEMKEGMSLAGVDADSCRWLLYRSDYTTEKPELLELTTGKDGELEWRTIKTYSKSTLSTSPERLEQVVKDFRNLTNSCGEHGLVLWSHATGWMPPKNSGKYSFGQDNSLGNDRTGREMDIKAMAQALPRNFFTFIWCDCCYMAGVEVAWELRDRCDWYVAYPTEVEGDGMPYHLVIPTLLENKLHYDKAAEIFYRYYAERSSYANATISVIRTNSLQHLADACRQLMYNSPQPSTSGLQQYNRTSQFGPFYDLKDLCLAYANGNTADIRYHNVVNALNDVVVYAAATDTFRELRIDADHFCGISSGICQDNQEYYRQLGWYKTIFE